MANALYPDIWPSVMKFESEIVAMTASMVNGGVSTVCGTTSTVSPLLLFISNALILHSSIFFQLGWH
jgi:glutamate/tyrosine decarboxylase-like PLP-dependent enzyme